MNWHNKLRHINIGLFVIVVAVILRFAPQMPWNQPAPVVEPAVEAHPSHDWVDPARGLKIIMFYATPAVIERGETAILCYGVSNADSVSLDPPAAEIKPSLNRCIEVKPTATTAYTLTAANSRGEEQTQAVEVAVTGTRATKASPAAAPDAAEGVKIDYFRLDETKREEGMTLHRLCFRVWNAELVEVQPAAFPASKVFQGCFAVVPKRETTYTLTARGKDGAEVTQQLTLAP